MKFGLLIALMGVLFLVGCTTTSAYLLTGEYINPKTATTDQIIIPVSQYEYDSTVVGSQYPVTVHTSLMGIKKAVGKESLNGTFMAEQVPLVIVVGGIWFGIVSAWKNRRGWAGLPGVLIVPLLMLVIGVFLIGTTQPEFTTTATIIDKTFQIMSY